MSDAGFIYALINPSMAGLVKIGKTIKDPQERANELSKATGVPIPFIVAYQLAVKDCTIAEKFIHTYLEAKGHKIADNREFFNAPLNVAIDAILKFKDIAGVPINYTESDLPITKDGLLDELTTNNSQPWQELLELADDHYYGNNDTLEDYTEAIRLYKQAAKLGSTKAYIQLGHMYINGYGCSKNNEVALEYFKEGARMGDIDCYAEMERFFIVQIQHMDNANKCWNKYVSNVAISDPNVGKYCLGYINCRLILDIEIPNPKAMSAFKDKMIEWALQMIEYVESTDSNPDSTQSYQNALSYTKAML